MKQSKTDNKIGMFDGVLVPNITMMLGVILFLRLGVIVGHAGIGQMIGVIMLSLGFMVITSLSIASLATNMSSMGGGGVYYLITRSLGVEIGGAVGFALYLSQIISMTLTVSGFAYTLCDMYPQLSITWVEVGTFFTLASISSISSKGALRMQVVILAILLLGVGSVFFGSMNNVPPLVDATPIFSSGTLRFWQAFAFFYPALTGIEAGMAMSGILRNPGRSLFIGNLTSLFFVAALYLGVSIFSYVSIPTDYLVSDPFIFVTYSSNGFLVSMGILTATISSALGSILGAPRILESMAKDGLVPSIFGKVYGAYKEPRWALWSTVAVATLTAIFTNIDQIIPILTMICLITYTLLNFVAGLNELMNTASWRPVVQVPWWLSLAGAFIGIIMMLFVNVTWTIAATILFVALFLLLQGRNLDVGYRDIRDSLTFFFSRTALYHLGSPAEHALVWHPQILVMATNLAQQRKLTHLTYNLTERSGLVSYAAIVPVTWQDPEQILSSKTTLESYLEKEGITGLVQVVPAESNFEGQQNLIRTYGIGPLQPNTIAMSIVENDFENLLKLIESCQTLQKNLLLFRDSDQVNEEFYLDPDQDKVIDLWWNGDDRNGFDLSVSLATTLLNTKMWSDAEYNLRAICNSESAHTTIQTFFDEFITKSRLHFEPTVHLEPESYDYLPYINKHSSNADLTIICIRSYAREDTPRSYLEYLNQVWEYTKDLKDCLYISSYDNVEHKEIYEYPTGN